MSELAGCFCRIRCCGSLAFAPTASAGHSGSISRPGAWLLLCQVLTAASYDAVAAALQALLQRQRLAAEAVEQEQKEEEFHLQQAQVCGWKQCTKAVGKLHATAAHAAGC